MCIFWLLCLLFNNCESYYFIGKIDNSMSPFKYYIGHFDPIVFFCVLNYIQHGLRYDKLFPYIKMWYAVVKTDFCRL